MPLALKTVKYGLKTSCNEFLFQKLHKKMYHMTLFVTVRKVTFDDLTLTCLVHVLWPLLALDTHSIPQQVNPVWKNDLKHASHNYSYSCFTLDLLWPDLDLTRIICRANALDTLSRPLQVNSFLKHAPTCAAWLCIFMFESWCFATWLCPDLCLEPSHGHSSAFF